MLQVHGGGSQLSVTGVRATNHTVKCMSHMITYPLTFSPNIPHLVWPQLPFRMQPAMRQLCAQSTNLKCCTVHVSYDQIPPFSPLVWPQLPFRMQLVWGFIELWLNAALLLLTQHPAVLATACAIKPSLFLDEGPHASSGKCSHFAT